MKTLNSTLVFLFMLSFPALLFSQNLPFNNDYAFGLDVSFVKQREDSGEKYMDTDSIIKPCLQIFREHGYNWGRIMICNEPTSNRLPQNLQYVISAAQDLKKHGNRFLLDFMMSNGWANPMVQPVPTAWKDLSHREKVNAVYQYVRETMDALKKAGVMPEIVQVGNEIGNGLLWPDGRIQYDSLETAKWKNVAEYLSAGIRAIREVEAGGKKIRVMLHVDHGGDIFMTKTFFDKMLEYKVDYDILGFSFYPWSHGTLMDLRDNMAFSAKRYGKEIILVETGYYWRQSNYFKNVKPPFPETPEGQKEWLKTVNEIVLEIPDGLGKGVFWWEPMSRGRGYFDEERKAQPIINAFEKYALPLQRSDGQTRIQ